MMSKENLVSEEWLPVRGYEGFYEISSHGRIRRLERYVTQLNCFGTLSVHKYRGGLLKPRAATNGYLYVHLSKDGVRKTSKIHRLVAMHFLKVIDGLNVVNHKDGVKTNNHFENLEWCTVQQNKDHAVANGLVQNQGYGVDSFSAKYKFGVYSLSGEFIRYLVGVREIEDAGFTYNGVYLTTMGKQKSHKGFTFKKEKLHG